MKTDEFIALLSTDAGARGMTIVWRTAAACAVGAAFVAIAVLEWIGVRADFPEAFGRLGVALKFVVNVALAIGSFTFCVKASRPDAEPRLGLFLLPAAAALMCGAALELAVTPSHDWRAAALGETAGFCLAFIVGLSLVPLAAVLIALRKGASSHPGATGAGAGLLTGSLSAALYALHCTENSALFVALWYAGGVLLVAGLGLLAGRRVLDW